MKVLERRDRIEVVGGEAVFVVFDQPEAVRAAMLRDLDPPFPVLHDVERRAYGEWGLRRASLLGIYLDPKLWRDYARLLLRGERPSRPGRDTLQLGGDFVIAPDGMVAWARPQKRDDRPPVAVVLRELERAAAT